MSALSVQDVMMEAACQLRAWQKAHGQDRASAEAINGLKLARIAVSEMIEDNKDLMQAAQLLSVERAEFRRERDALANALRTVMTMDVKGHQLQDRLQFSTPGREILEQCNSALAALSQPATQQGGE